MAGGAGGNQFETTRGVGGAPVEPIALRNCVSEMTTLVGEGLSVGDHVGVGEGSATEVRVSATVGEVESPATPEAS